MSLIKSVENIFGRNIFYIWRMYKELKQLFCVRVFVTVSIVGMHFILYLSVYVLLLRLETITGCFSQVHSSGTLRSLVYDFLTYIGIK